MTERSYHQRCPISRALDVVGERWGLLIVRELMLGPSRYGELLAALPAMGTKVLAERLKELVARGVIVSTDAGYALTERGAKLGPVLGALAAWGQPLLAREDPEDTSPPSTIALMLVGRVVERAPGEDTTIQLHVDRQPFVLRVRGASSGAKRGEAAEREGTLALTVAAAIDLLDERTTLADEVARERVSLEGLSRRRIRELFAFRVG